MVSKITLVPMWCHDMYTGIFQTGIYILYIRKSRAWYAVWTTTKKKTKKNCYLISLNMCLIKNIRLLSYSINRNKRNRFY